MARFAARWLLLSIKVSRDLLLLEAQKDSARRKAHHEARQAAQLNASGGSAFDHSWDEQLSFMAAGDESDPDS